MRKKSTVALIALLLVVSLNVGCGKVVHVKHPNQFSDLDGYGYDAITVAQASLDEAKKQLAAGKFNDRRSAAVAIINSGGASYDVAHASWVAYRDALAGLSAGNASDLESKLRQDLSDMAAAIARVKSLTGGK